LEARVNILVPQWHVHTALAYSILDIAQRLGSNPLVERKGDKKAKCGNKKFKETGPNKIAGNICIRHGANAGGCW
jgi:hypothetical protein